MEITERDPGRALIRGHGLGSARNGLPAAKPYAYRGKLPLASELPYECAGGCGRRMNRSYRNSADTCAVCRGYFQDGAGRGGEKGRAARDR